MTSPSVVTLVETGDELQANLWADALRDEGVRTEIVARGTRDALGGGSLLTGTFFRLLVMSEDLDYARGILADLGGPSHYAESERLSDSDPMRLVWIMAGVIALFLGLGWLMKVAA
jgi:ribulose 1,5-bisphosphate synthetase/thiazole synthase